MVYILRVGITASTKNRPTGAKETTMKNATNKGLYGWDEMEVTLLDVNAGKISGADGLNRLWDKLNNAFSNDPLRPNYGYCLPTYSERVAKIKPTIDEYNRRRPTFDIIDN